MIIYIHDNTNRHFVEKMWKKRHILDGFGCVFWVNGYLLNFLPFFGQLYAIRGKPDPFRANRLL